MHGTKDALVRVHHGRAVFDAAPEPKELWCGRAAPLSQDLCRFGSFLPLCTASRASGRPVAFVNKAMHASRAAQLRACCSVLLLLALSLLLPDSPRARAPFRHR